MKMAAIFFFLKEEKTLRENVIFYIEDIITSQEKKINKLIIGINLSHVIIVLLDHPQINITI